MGSFNTPNAARIRHLHCATQRFCIPLKPRCEDARGGGKGGGARRRGPPHLLEVGHVRDERPVALLELQADAVPLTVRLQHLLGHQAVGQADPNPQLRAQSQGGQQHQGAQAEATLQHPRGGESEPGEGEK